MNKILPIGFICGALLISNLSFGQKVTPQTDGSNYYFQVANVYFEVDPSFGARITSFKLDDKEVLYTVTGSGMYGSTFWQSPQSAWGWPPSEALDQYAYSGGITGDSVNLISQIDNKYSTQLKFRKIFTADLTDTSVTIDYFMNNNATSSKSYAPWEITRVPVGGIAFYPDSGGVTGVLAPKFEKIVNLQWINYTGATLGGGTNKMFGNSKEGWLAWINSDSSVFIKKFKNIQKNEAATGENEVEIYYNGPGTYYEIENQGAYKSIAAGDSLKWTVKWYLRKLPADVDNSKGSLALANFVRKAIGIAPVDTSHVGLHHSILKDKISLSPNPGNDYLKISGLSGPANLIITDLSGRILLASSVDINQNLVSVHSLNDGLYFYNISSLESRSSGKLVIKK
jgi:hypothetical protein